MTIKHEDWLKKAARLYGENAGDWNFICPICKTPQTGKDFVKAGLTKEQASTSIANECIGRFLPEKQKAIGEKKIVKGRPCNYAGYGIFQLNPVEIEFEDGTIRNAFDFADEELDVT